MDKTVSLQQTKEQERAKWAWQEINEVNKYPHEKVDDIKKKYRAIVLKSPILILTNGLGQTAAFFASKSQPKEGKQPSSDNIAHRLLLNHLWSWLERVKICSALEGQIQESHRLPFWITHATTGQYRLATTEVLSCLQWLRRFAEAVLPEPEE